jgi:hypothetical protein
MMMLKLCQAVCNMSGLRLLNLSGNNLPFFCVDALANSSWLPRILDLSDTRMDDLTAYHLLQILVKRPNS